MAATAITTAGFSIRDINPIELMLIRRMFKFHLKPHTVGRAFDTERTVHDRIGRILDLV